VGEQKNILNGGRRVTRVKVAVVCLFVRSMWLALSGRSDGGRRSDANGRSMIGNSDFGGEGGVGGVPRRWLGRPPVLSPAGRRQSFGRQK